MESGDKPIRDSKRWGFSVRWGFSGIGTKRNPSDALGKGGVLWEREARS